MTRAAKVESFEEVHQWQRQVPERFEEEALTLFDELREAVCFEYDVYSVFWWPGTENGGPGW
ncbi:hypothetical protein SADUNF_Sadunf05G0032900 [Salix dunnii]|uniref:Uncharacterized protein n=1 Tax=Salix dunnii TaxID=1413687 RepID=A0A835N3H8_9ROSI|nr:hypothetical protein SADUNF_Sadunf05G0032900 [Salix dunnii]